jgi:hypothetical protein
MITCPLCEHAQAEAGECEICGYALGSGSGAAARPPPMDGLERAGYAPAPAVHALPVEGLEPTAHARVGPVVAPPLELEPTGAAPLDVDAPALDGLERTAADPVDDPTPMSAFVACRYCRTPALPGERICGRCGMRLSLAAGGSKEPVGGAGRACGCGALVRGRACPSCGARA